MYSDFVCHLESMRVARVPRVGHHCFRQDVTLMHWPPRFPDLSPYDFFLWGFVKDTVFVSPVLANLQELHDRITAAVALIDCDMLTRVWKELDYGLDVCHISQGEHIEHL